MKINKLLMRKRIFPLLFMALALQVQTFAQTSEICGYLFGSGNSRAYLKAETNVAGQMTVTILPFDPYAETASAYTAFRNDGLTTARVELITVNGDANTGNKYFTRTISGTGATRIQMVFTPVAGMVFPGDQIVFPGGAANLEWRTPNNTNAYGPVPYTYTYGTSCISLIQLDTPTNVAVSSSDVLTFDPVSGATGYVVMVYANAVKIGTISVAGSGETISFPFTGNYTVTVVALGDGTTTTDSNQSASVNWGITIPDKPNLPLSNSCGIDVPNAVAGNPPANITVETVGNEIVITLNSANTNWRAAGVDISGFTVAGINGSAVLNKVSTATGNPQRFSPKAGITIPKGTLITFNGTMEWVLTVPATANGYRTGSIFSNYEYGSTCTPPVAVDPEIDCNSVAVSDITSDGATVTVPLVAGATYPIAADGIVFVPTSGGGSNITFNESLSGTYSLTGLDPDTNYAFNVYALDTQGGQSTVCSGKISFKTASVTPPLPCNLIDGVSFEMDVRYWNGAPGDKSTWAYNSTQTWASWNDTAGILQFTAPTSAASGTDYQIRLEVAPYVQSSASSGHINDFFVGQKEYTVSFDITSSAAVAANLLFTKANAFPGGSGMTIPITFAAGTHKFEGVYTNSAAAGVTTVFSRIQFNFGTCPNGTVVTISNISICEYTPNVGIETQSADSEVIDVQYFSIDGRPVLTPAAGLYIVKKTRKDGSVITEKVFIK